MGLALLCACTPEPATPPDVVLITIDALRADRCSLYGYDRPTTPFLDAMAARSSVFEAASATSSWTAPSMASLFTSLPARSHGVVRGFFWDGKVLDQDLLRDEFETLAEVLRAHGYETFGVSTNGHLWRETGFGQGFDSFVELPWEPAELANEYALKFRDRLEAAKSFFLWVHYFDPHSPYEKRQPWYSQYKAEKRPLDAEPDVEIPADAMEILTDLRDRYDSEINRVDASIRQLFEELEIRSDTLVVVTADHGEAFYEHGKVGHGTSLFREEIRVPLLIHWPRQTAPRRIETPVSLVDIYPTILDILDIPPPSGLAGRSLIPLMRGGDFTDRVVVSELDRGKETGARTALRWLNWEAHTSINPDSAPLLFDLANDPGQKQDLSAVHPERLEALQQRLEEWKATWQRAEAPRKVAPFVAEEDRERLRMLGYLE